MKNLERKKTKVLFCTGSFITGSGGVASYAHDFIHAFPNFQFVVLTNDNYKKVDESFDVLKLDMEDWSIVNVRKLLNLIDDEKPDIIINSYCKLLALAIPYVSNSIKVISISHFTDGGYAWAAGLNGIYYDSIVALSTYAKAFLEHMFNIKDGHKVNVVYNFMPSLPNVQLQTKKTAKVLKIVYPGGHSWQKSAEIVADAMQQLCRTSLPFELLWLGNIDLPGGKWPLAKTKTIKDCLPINDSRIKHVGRVERTEAKEIIASANIFLLPSRGEGCPISLIEAMRGGCIPIISDAQHGSLDIIENGKTGFVVKQGSVDQLVDQIKDIIENHSSYSEIYDNSKSVFEEKLEYRSWKYNMESILALSSNHEKRVPFDKRKYFSDVCYFRMLYFFDWLRDRFLRQVYHIVYFRYLHFKLKFR